MEPTRRIVTWGLAAVGVLLAVAALASWPGRIVYTLDDAYIHLALAERIGQGTYGINPGEFAAPASSVLWPLVLSLAPSGLAREVLPLAINVLVTVGSVRILLELAARTGLAEVLGERRFGVWLLVALLVGNLVGILFTGLEHAAHILASLAVLRGLLRLDEGRAPGVAFWLGIVVGPLLRYEGLAISGPALLIAAHAGHRAGALLAGSAVVAGVGGFSLWLMQQGQQALPSSVMVKLEVLLVGGVQRFTRLGAWTSLAFLLGCVGLVGLSAWRGRCTSWRTATAVVVVVVAHVLFGRFGWFGRYEVYAVLFAAAGALAVGAPLLVDFARTERWAAWRPLVLGVILLVPVSIGTVLAPFAMRDITTQHIPMHLFTQHFDGVVACNDLGWVAYRAPHRVVDLWGLGSERARQRRAVLGPTGAYLAEVTEHEGVGVAMIYASWFREVPPHWQRLGILVSPWPNAGADERMVLFFLVDPAQRDAAEAALEEMITRLPASARFVRQP